MSIGLRGGPSKETQEGLALLTATQEELEAAVARGRVGLAQVDVVGGGRRRKRVRVWGGGGEDGEDGEDGGDEDGKK